MRRKPKGKEKGKAVAWNDGENGGMAKTVFRPNSI